MTFMFSEMMKCMIKIALLDIELSKEERKLLSLAFKKAIRPRKTSLEIILRIEKKVEVIGDEEKLEMTRQYRSRVYYLIR